MVNVGNVVGILVVVYDDLCVVVYVGRYVVVGIELNPVVVSGEKEAVVPV